MHNIAIVIPAYNESSTISHVVENVKKHVSYVIVVDDGSKDDTKEKAKKAGAIVVSLLKNSGYDAALDAGFKVAIKKKPEIIITFDADDQHDPSDIEKVVKPILDGEADVVVGRRIFKQRIMEHLFSIYSRKKIKISDPLSGVKAYRTDVYRKVGYFDRIGSTGTELMFSAYKLGFKLKEIPIHFKKRKDIPRFGKSLKGNWKIMLSFFRILLGA